MKQNVFDSGYLCGAIVGKGTFITDHNKGKYSIGVESQDRELIDSFYDKLSTHMKKKPKKYTRNKNSNLLYSAVYHGKDEVLAFNYKFSVQGKSHDWNVPVQVFESINFRKGFLQGYFDSKARIKIRYRKRKYSKVGFDKVRCVRISSVNKGGLEQIKTLLETFEVGCNISTSGKNNILDIEGKLRLNKFRNKIGFGLSQKIQELDEALDTSRLI